MTNPVSQAKQDIAVLLDGALERAVESGALPAASELPDFVVEIPADTSHGDFASNIAMACARPFKCAPRKIAEAICAALDLTGTVFELSLIHICCEYRFLLRLFAHIDIDGVFTRKQRVDVKGIGKFKPAAVVVEMRNDAVA